MNARQIEIFRTIMRKGSLTAAANALAVSQPAISKSLRHFESHLGYMLFDRIGGRLVPTAEAEMLYADADRIFREIELLDELALNIRERRVGLLRIGVSLSMIPTILPTALMAFKAHHPTVKIQIHTQPKADISEQLQIGGIDMGLTVSTIQAPTIRNEILATTPVVAVLLAEDPLATLPAVTVEDLKDRPLISYGSQVEIGAMLDDAFEQIGVTRPLAIQVSSSLVAAPLVQAGLGIALIDGFMQWDKYPGLVTRPFRPQLTMNLAISTNSDKPASRLLSAFRLNLRDAIRQYQTDHGTDPRR